ncbi:MAG: sulfite exporter TauE/SafE family protein [Sphingomonadales bacterium]|nr:sulfite exporter TauE/SafE family protein [Sphingomonadales bacterium]MBK9433328.1 sulfite exporter TauE/SafE family protein [Sphingomonadales bacterium]MBL0022640.1 sulfite exporter TauE/SafE family protein [Sphingomonadales bacterium]
MMLEPIQYVLGAGSGALVGFVLGLVGGGGSILAVPLMVYLVGVKNPHVAIGTSALAVAANALANLIPHARKGNVIWRCGGMYAFAGAIGAFAGSTIGKAFDGQKLLLLFALLMLVVGVLMFKNRNDVGDPGATCHRENAPKVIAYGSATGLFSGFFGIGGGFLIVPGLIAATHMPMVNAVGSSLVAIAAFGLSTSFNYALSGLVDWWLAAAFIGGGVVGGWIGTIASTRLAQRKGTLNTLFATLIFVVAAYMIYRSVIAL